MIEFLPRNALEDLRSKLSRYNCALLLGPRQVGKTELAKKLGEEFASRASYLDLELKAYEKQIRSLDDFVQVNRDQELIILDEVQCVPDLFPQLRGQLDHQRQTGFAGPIWLLLGSATAELQSLVGKHLSGRYSTIDLTPFHLTEVGQTNRLTIDQAVAPTQIAEIAEQAAIAPAFSRERLQSLWLRGGFPLSFLAANEEASMEWRRMYLRSIYEHQSVAVDTVSRPDLLLPLWERLSINQGQPCNLSDWPRQLGCKQDVLLELLRYLVNSRMLRELRPWCSNESKKLDKQPIYFIRDSGLLHTNWGFLTLGELMSHKIKGKSWEGFVIETLIAVAPPDTQAFFYRDKNKNEIDLVLEFNLNCRWAIEVKLSPGIKRGFFQASRELGAEDGFMVHSGPESLKIGPGSGIDALCLPDAIARVRSFQ